MIQEPYEFLQKLCIWDGLIPSNHLGSKSAEKDVGALADSKLNMRE